MSASSWFFPVSKALAFVLLPSHVLFWLVAATALALLAGRMRTARVAGLMALLLFILIGVAPTGLMAVKPLEDLYPRRPLPAHIDGILTLGGGLGVPELLLRHAPGSAPSIDRIVSTYELARQHPEARVVFTGGWEPYPDSIAAREDFLRMGLESRRLTLESNSRNTYENFTLTQALVKPRPGETWVLATSAVQLPRAMQVAQRVGWPMIAWPTDYKTTTSMPLASRWWRIGDNLGEADDAVHEWLGQVVYAAAGLTGKHK